MILVSFIAIMSNFILMQLKRCWRSSIFLLKERAFTWNRGSDLFQCYAFPQCNNIWMKKFLRVITITKSSKFEEDFNDNELLWSFSRSFDCVMLLSVFVQQARKFLLLDKELKGKIIVLQQSMQYQDSSLFWRYL